MAIQDSETSAEKATRADRLFQIAALLRDATEAAPATADGLAATLGVSARTIYRDMDGLRSNGVPVAGSPGVGYWLPEGGADNLPAPRGKTPTPVRHSAVRPMALPPASAPRAAIRAMVRAPEPETVVALAREARFEGQARRRVALQAEALVKAVRENRRNEGGIDLFMHEYSLSSEEGVALMCLAEALLRIPDAETADQLIEDKIGGAKWEQHLGRADSLFVNASTLGLMVTGRVLRLGGGGGLQAALGRLVHRSGEPVIRAAIRQAMRIMGRQFVMGRTIGEALERVSEDAAKGYRASFDMLGEAAYTDADAKRYLKSYLGAIAAVGKANKGEGPTESHGVSVKLSALHPRYEFAQRDRVTSVLYDRLLEVAEAAATADIGLCLDAEEADRLDLSLDLIARLAHEPSLKGWQGLGLAIQAYQKRARPLIDWLAALAKDSDRRLMVRLVKGAYWDAEVKRAQEAGLDDFPVFTRKAHTDVSYIACAHALFEHGPAFYPCFATHNAHTAASVLELAGDRDPRGEGGWEFQRLHGMGAPLYRPLVEEAERPAPCRIYSPVGGHEDLLAYLVRRLLENGANTSFVNRITDDSLPIEEIIHDPVHEAETGGFAPHPGVKPPMALFEPRRNSRGFDLSDPVVAERLAATVTRREAQPARIEAAPITSAAAKPAKRAGAVEIRNPADRGQLVGTVIEATPEQAKAALERAVEAQPDWDEVGANARAEILERAADLYEENSVGLMRLCVREAGKTWKDAVAELREAVDFLRYYAAEARRLYGAPEEMPGPTGERNTYRLCGRGAWLCVSPWNFPLAIFTGQAAAALAAGNSVLAKPAEQTPLIAHAAVELLLKAGVPAGALHLLPGDGAKLGGALIPDPRLAGVAFTGSTAVAKIIQRQLAERDGPIAPLIAETGGLNVMIVDSSALPEQVTRDVLISAFQSAGQRCSALRVLYLQEDCAERQIEMIKGAMAELRMGDPAWLASDVGPVIDADAKASLEAHAAKLRAEGRLLAETPLPGDLPEGYWVAPQMHRIDGVESLDHEPFGPILHVATWKADGLDRLIDRINASGYGLTLGVHSRVERKCRHIAARARVGNVYVNRNQIGAIVGSQPFGGEGLSGTGPKAGGPNYLARFGVERTVSVDLTAQGGDAALMTLEA